VPPEIPIDFAKDITDIPMNKIVIGSIAASAGMTLLLSGAGTFALWNSNTSTELSGITTGTLDPDTAGTWAAGTPELWVPGDSSNYTESYTIIGSGDDLAATLTGAYSGITVDGVTATFAFAVEDKNGNAVPANTNRSYSFSSALSPYSAVATVDVEFNATGTTNQKSVAEIGDVEVSLQQVTTTASAQK
jgi:alternate signal-mediated exported protein